MSPGGRFCPTSSAFELSGDRTARPHDTAEQAGLCGRPLAISLGTVLTPRPRNPAAMFLRGARSALMLCGLLEPLCQPART